MYFHAYLIKLKLKPTPFGIAHRSKGNPFQVHLTVSTDYIGYSTTRMMKEVLLMFLGEVESCSKLTYLAISPFRTEGADFQMFPCRGGS